MAPKSIVIISISFVFTWLQWVVLSLVILFSSLLFSTAFMVPWEEEVEFLMIDFCLQLYENYSYFIYFSKYFLCFLMIPRWMRFHLSQTYRADRSPAVAVNQPPSLLKCGHYRAFVLHRNIHILPLQYLIM